MDDVKDAPHDREHEPDRPIPRGLVTEAEADMLTVGLLFAEAALFAPLGKAAFLHWAFAALYTVLMRIEFFIGPWLDRRVLAYATSHMVVMPLVFAFILASGAAALVPGDLDVSGEARTLALVALLGSYCIGLAFELGRKFQRYFAAHGPRAWSLWVVSPSVGVMCFTYVAREAYDAWVLGAMAAVSLLTIVLHARVMAHRPRLLAADKGAGVHTGQVLPGATYDEAAWEQYPASTVTRLELLPGVAGLLTFLVLAVGGMTEVPW